MKKFLILFIFFLFISIALPLKAQAVFDSGGIKEVWLVRGSNMWICPFEGYSDQIKQRINDSKPYYAPEEYIVFHPNPSFSGSEPGCLNFLYGQLETVPFGQEQTKKPTEYIYIFDNTIIREDKVLTSSSLQFSDEKLIYKKVLSFKALDPLTGQSETLPNTLFWFRGSEVYGKIGDVSEGVIEYKGKYYRHDGAQYFVNNVLLWKNPTPASGSVTPLPIEEPQVTNIPLPSGPIPTWYQNGISWRTATYNQTYEGLLYPTDLQSWLNPPGRLIGFRLDLPGSLASTEGLVATLQSCSDSTCSQKGFDEAMFISDKDGRLLDNILHTTKVDLNTEYFRTNRTVYLLVGSKDAPAASGSKFRFYYGRSQ